MVLFLFCSSSIVAQDYSTRNYYGQKLEPINGIIHGAGQDPGQNGGYDQPFFDGYVAEMDSGEFPMSYMYYEGIQGINESWARNLRKKLLKYEDQLIVIQFGLYLVNQLDLIADGSLDEELDIWLDGLEEIGLPVYVRIGYEFNGSWNNYEATSYVAAFKYITEKLRARDAIEAATVWNLAVEGNQVYMNYYPGDEYVDWWSINYFSRTDVDLSLSDNFLEDAHEHGKPVLIGESTPRYVGVTDGQDDWNLWFNPFFNHIASQKGIKMTGYINWEWADQSIEQVWNNWGDARLSSNQVVAQNFRDEMNDSMYMHMSQDKAFRLALGIDENEAPSTPENLSIVSEEYPLTIGWEPSVDTSGIARYIIYKDSSFFSFTANSGYQFYEFSDGEEFTVSVEAIDRAGNRSPVSESLALTAPTSGGVEEPDSTGGANILSNVEFDDGKTPWVLQNFSGGAASASFEVDNSSVLSGETSALIDIIQNSGTNFHILLEQRTELVPGVRYRIEYIAKASEEASMETWIQEQSGSFSHFTKTVSLSTEPTHFLHFFVAPQNHNTEVNTFLKFMMGTSGITKIWIDSVTVSNLSVTTSEDSQLEEIPNSISLLQNYPNPFNPTTRITYSLPSSGLVSLTVYNVQGVEVAKLVDGPQSQGIYSLEFEAPDLSSGVYFYRLKAGSEIITKKMLLIK